MSYQKDIVAHNIKILNEKEVSLIQHSDEDYIFAALTVEGGGVFKKGLAIGIQEKMVPGLIIYDNENFFGFSEKYGLCLLSGHPEYNLLEIPENTFLKKEERNIIQPSQTEHSNNMNLFKDTEKDDNKYLNIDIQIKESNNFYITIPKIHSNNKFTLTFNITYIYDIGSIISNVKLVFINQSEKNVFFNITNNETYYDKDFSNEIEAKSVNKINLEIINEDCFIINKNIYYKK
jgi:hypothetical protein